MSSPYFTEYTLTMNCKIISSFYARITLSQSKYTHLQTETHEHDRIPNGKWIVIHNRVYICEHKLGEQKIHDESVRAGLEFGQEKIVSNNLKQRPYVTVKTLMKTTERVHG